MKNGHDIYDRRTLDRLYRLAVSILGITTEAEDAVHDVMEKMWRRRTETGGIRDGEAFAVTATRNICIDRLRQRKPCTDSIPEREADCNPAGYDDREIVRMAMGSLPEKQRSIIHMKDIEGYSTKEIADIFSIGENQVRTILSRARKAMKEKIEKEIGYGQHQ